MLCINYLLLKARRTCRVYYISNSYHRCSPSTNTLEVLWIYKCWLCWLPTWQQHSSASVLFSLAWWTSPLVWRNWAPPNKPKLPHCAMASATMGHPYLRCLSILPPWRNQVDACCHPKLCNITQILFWPLKRSQITHLRSPSLKHMPERIQTSHEHFPRWTACHSS